MQKKKNQSTKPYIAGKDTAQNTNNDSKKNSGDMEGVHYFCQLCPALVSGKFKFSVSSIPYYTLA